MLETAVINYDSGLTLGSKEMKQQGSIWVQILNTNFDNSAESEERKEMNDREGRTKLETAVIKLMGLIFISGLALASRQMTQQGNIWVQILISKVSKIIESEETKEMDYRERRTKLESAVIKSPSWDSGRTFGIKANDTARQHFWAQILNTNFDNSAESEEK